MNGVHQPNFNLSADAEPGYGKLFAIAWRRRFWVVGVLVCAIAAGAAYTFQEEPTYVSSMQLLVESNYKGKVKQPNSEDTSDEFADSNVELDTGTQVNLMQSSGLLKRAMQLLQTDYPEFDANDPESVAKFKRALTVKQVLADGKGTKESETKIFEVIYTNNDAEKTQDVLKAVQKVYLDYNLEQQKARLTRGLAFINEQIPKIKDKVKQSEAALEQFRTGQELIDPEVQAKAQADTLNQLQQQQQTNLAQIRELRSRYASLQQQLALSPQQAIFASRLSQSTRYQSLLNEIQKTELALVQERLRFKDRAPFVQQIVEQRRKQLELLKVEVDRILGDRAPRQKNNQLLAEGQLGALDVTLINQLVEAQVNLEAAEARYQSLARAEQEIRSELKRFPKLLAEYGRLQPEVELNRDTLKELLKAGQDLGLEIARGGFDWQIVEEPQLGQKTGPSLPRNLMLGAVVGLLLGGLAAFARESADDAVYSSDELKQQSSVPLLGVIPALSSGGSKPLALPFQKSQELTPTIEQVLHWKPLRESLDLLYQNIQLSSSGSPLKSLVVTSALAGEGKSMLILGLAISAARLHQRVLLIDADLRRPSLHKLMNLPNDVGLSTLLTSETPIPQQMDTQSSNLRSNVAVLTAGPTPTDPAKLLSSPRMREVMATFEQNYDLVLLDAPPVLGMVDAVLAASCCSGTLLVGRIGQVTRTELNQAIAALSQLNLIGMVANGSDAATNNSVYQAQTV